MIKDDFDVILPVEHIEKIPIECPVCKLFMKNDADTEFYKEYKCCQKCALRWAEANKEKWYNGWRPTKEQIALEIKNRRIILPILTD